MYFQGNILKYLLMIHLVAVTIARDQQHLVENYVKFLNLQLYCLRYLERTQIMTIGDHYSFILLITEVLHFT